MGDKQVILKMLSMLYGDEAESIYKRIESLLEKYDFKTEEGNWVDENDVMVITYADTVVSNDASGIKNLSDLFDKYIKKSVSAIHLLPFFEYSSDDGFSVIDYKKPHSEAGTWEEINHLSQNYDLMFDAVINHISRYSDWFQEYLSGNVLYKNYFIECDPSLDYLSVTRPRALPLLTEVETKDGIKHVWTTFSDDQIDLNYKSSDVLIDILDVLLFYVKSGARYLRLDAIGFMWKEIGTSCMHLEKTHECIKLMRKVIEQVDRSVVLITETNTPHEENISYFGKEYDEAHMVYQFPLPPLTAHAFLTEDSTTLMKWYENLEHIDNKATYFNFLASHDGIGVRPTEGILDDSEIEKMVVAVTKRHGRVSYRNMADGSKKPYELNISFLSLICSEDDSIDLKVEKFMACQAILLSVIGVPGIYIHSLLGSENDIEGMITSGINRRINREKLDKYELFDELDNDNSLRAKVLKNYSELLNIRKTNSAFAPSAKQTSEYIDKRIFAITRENDKTKDKVKVRINISSKEIPIKDIGKDIISGKDIDGNHVMKCYEILWIV